VRGRTAGVGVYKEEVPFVPCWGCGEVDRKMWRRPVAGWGRKPAKVTSCCPSSAVASILHGPGVLALLWASRGAYPA
jgi:hypothetical protein